MSDCEHQYRSDVETCPWCELRDLGEQYRRLKKDFDELFETARTLTKERDIYKEHAEYWRQHKLEDGLNPALQHLAMEYLPDWAWINLGLASTTYCWWKRLRDLLEKGPPEQS